MTIILEPNETVPEEIEATAARIWQFVPGGIFCWKNREGATTLFLGRASEEFFGAVILTPPCRQREESKSTSKSTIKNPAPALQPSLFVPLVSFVNQS